MVGFMDEPFAINHLRAACVVVDPSDAALSAEWNVARAKLGAPVTNAGAPSIEALPPEGLAHVANLLAQPWVQIAFQGMLGASFQMVEVEPLLAQQFTVDCARSDHHNGGNGHVPTIEEMLSICLPVAQSVEQIEIAQAPGSMMLTSRSLNFRMLAQGFLHGAFLGMQVGLGLPFAHVVRCNGKCYLHNGFHRAVGLRKRGATHIPCVFRDVPDHGSVGIVPGGTFDVPLLESPNPPTLAHFTQGRAYDVQLKVYRRTLHISWADYVTTQE